MLLNNPLTIADINITEKNSGPDRGKLQGSTPRLTPQPVLVDYVAVSRDIQILHRDVSLSADIKFVNSIPFFISVSDKIKFTTAEFMRSQKIV